MNNESRWTDTEMPPGEYPGAPFMIPIERLLFKEPVNAGMDIYNLASFAKIYRTTNEHLRPITVKREGSLFRIMDGRHRVVASMMAGRKSVKAIEEED